MTRRQTLVSLWSRSSSHDVTRASNLTSNLATLHAAWFVHAYQLQLEIWITIHQTTPSSPRIEFVATWGWRMLNAFNLAPNPFPGRYSECRIRQQAFASTATARSRNIQTGEGHLVTKAHRPVVHIPKSGKCHLRKNLYMSLQATMLPNFAFCLGVLYSI